MQAEGSPPATTEKESRVALVTGASRGIGRAIALALASADSVRTADTKRAPTEKPAFADGDVFSSLFEGRTAFRVASTTVRAETTFVVMAFTYDTQKPAVTWRDTLVVVGSASTAGAPESPSAAASAVEAIAVETVEVFTDLSLLSLSSSVVQVPDRKLSSSLQAISR